MNIPIKLNPREKKVMLIGGVIALAIIAYQLLEWYSGFKTSIKESSEAKLIILEKQINKISERETLIKKFESTDAQLKELEKGLLSGDKPPVAAAELQKLLKDMASSLNIEIKSERILNPVDMGSYMSVPVEIGFITSTAKLKELLYRIKTSPFLLNISEMNVRVTNIVNPIDAYTTLVVRGFIKKEITPPSKADLPRTTALQQWHWGMNLCDISVIHQKVYPFVADAFLAVRGKKG